MPTDHPRPSRRTLLAGGAVLLAGGLGVVSCSRDRPRFISGSPSPAPSASGSAAPSPSPATTGREESELAPREPGQAQGQPARLPDTDPATLVTISQSGWYSWALMDRVSGKMIYTDNYAETNFSASMIKCWIVSDYLRRAAEAGNTPSSGQMNELSAILRDSNNEFAQQVWNELGGNECAKRMMAVCGFTDSVLGPNWSRYNFAVRDVCRLADAIGDGRAAGTKWTSWVVSEMRQVRGYGGYGIRHAFNDDSRQLIAQKNGWVTRSPENFWTVNGLAFTDQWAMAVLTRYPTSTTGGAEHGFDIQATVAAQLRTRTGLV